MASSSVTENAASPTLNPRMMGSPGPHQASISPDDDFRVNVVQIGRSGICVFAFIDMFLVAFTKQIPTTVPLVLFLIATLAFNAHKLLAGHLMTRDPRLRAPFFSFELFCMRVTCGGDVDSDGESRSLLRGFEWLSDDSGNAPGIWQEVVEITLAVVTGILVFASMTSDYRYGHQPWDGDYDVCVSSYVFGWLIVSFELMVVFLEVFGVFRGATVYLCPDEDVEGHAQRQIRLPPSPPVAASRGGEHISIVA
ncbi:hypothetical protein PpBr36_08503 [Pyricularia pennisetigena]|uniref:hypothetical protein n=1 Tax=Pyricularia pennisetigena TaxID=1578925 RepID=UPI00114E0F6F|nr:hypothetical protein PpBr36_08503 [Pyricularia pennisetigena]TLS24220.1 hypothetical protein PpBr36_08503 [Pyricularia pennisetigena]